MVIVIACLSGLTGCNLQDPLDSGSPENRPTEDTSVDLSTEDTGTAPLLDARVEDTSDTGSAPLLDARVEDTSHSIDTGGDASDGALDVVSDAEPLVDAVALDADSCLQDECTSPSEDVGEDASGTELLPQPWRHADIGAVTTPGTVSYDAATGTFTTSVSSAPLWGTYDGLHFVYQPLSGDGTISARAIHIDDVHIYAKAGVMIREDLSPGSRHAVAFVTALSGTQTAFQRRLQTDDVTVHTGASGGPYQPPYWVRLEREGSLFSAFVSADGVDWLLIGTEVIDMSEEVYVGIITSTYDDTQVAEARFDDVRVVP
jgi:regulation of enolase protein 1 (concanavalin A-like superfamily)